MRTVVPDRVRWAVELLDPAPTEEILEIGGGPGVSAALICDRLTTGRLLAVDRSAVAIERTLRRNQPHLASGRLAVCQCALDALAEPPATFDRALALDVNLFWVRDATPELEVLRRLLRPGGRLLVLYGATSPAGAERVLGPVAAGLRGHGFVDVTTVVADAGMGATARVPD
ncbi:class I SAM-dependent methyltransferase [Candidatus Blastococcus massiliensis]|uniref:class I SAM-dependent methyltransferase n=1 Tax=Candidatus Blastococcus massiliensis TaxID=1470358 RepID=UPI0014124EF9|nr:class I SAM-dependent methyltransferase [Candidatus Blastococcus massiliensis]